MPLDVAIPFHNTYARLPERLHARVSPTAVAAPRLLRLNAALAEELGLDPSALASPEGVAVLGGSRVPAGAEPIAQAYAGHQFGHFVPRLGDGRAVLLGEVVDRQGRRRDLQLKGAGPTPFSRGGDGRAAIGPVLREFLVSEAMAALGIPTTRALSAVATGEAVQRERPLPGAVLCRVAASHIRVGSFQYLAARGDADGLRALADHAIARHDPEVAGAAQPYRAFLDGVVARQARLVASWMLVGFVHGVLNTDNTTVSGETLDYGPCAFLDAYDPGMVFSSIDHAGRYAFGAQPRAMQWNLARLAEALLPLLGADEEAALASARTALDGFAPAFARAHAAGLSRKIGLLTEREGDDALGMDLLERMAANGADMTLFFRRLCAAGEGDFPVPPDARAAAAPDVPADAAPAALRALFADPAALDPWFAAWRRRLAQETAAPGAREAAMRATNPAHTPRNHLVEAALSAAAGGDMEPFEAMLAVLSRPFEDRPDLPLYGTPPRPEERVLQTFCGT